MKVPAIRVLFKEGTERTYSLSDSSKVFLLGKFQKSQYTRMEDIMGASPVYLLQSAANDPLFIRFHDALAVEFCEQYI